MIAFLHGTLAEKTPSTVVLDVQGVGYELFISLSTYDRLPATGSKCRLLTYYHVRQDTQVLFGFAQTEEKQMFERLINVNGVGPKLALSVLSGLTVAELVAAIAESNVKRISSVHGIGKKTAERIIVELRDKVDPLEALAGRTAGGGDARNAMLRDAILALGQLGFPQDQARKMVQAALDADPAITDTEALLRKALSR
ncbi:MAG: Holliday junction branch migration protein RuvA [Kiritimatiellae bacterium]|jgi:Holliday junction DNA helicase RuvA|nr:Holliday junction branch migration protein RuvA [Kiritimatiellia bacterium]MDD3582848.1 Holliday junction branch migration protein RuvA [Kiritimatiellia bacterium]HHU15325.1 Holliday junction branch migration protein RuvA [Lentisphaerota bacterium]HON46478.1 Holliday junction branch migration protein RuvA [Kiritimatiellia bacterium]